MIHDLGRVGVSTAIWDKPSRLTDTERERVRLHPLPDRPHAGAGERARAAPARSPRVTTSDWTGPGYPRGLTASSLTPSDRLLAAADVYHAMTEPRPHRPALDGAAAARQLRAEVRAGRLDGDGRRPRCSGPRVTAPRPAGRGRPD